MPTAFQEHKYVNQPKTFMRSSSWPNQASNRTCGVKALKQEAYLADYQLEINDDLSHKQ